MSRHTPGPWTVPAWTNTQPPVIAAGREGVICRTDGACCPLDSRANARLIAAAPELLAALVGLLELGRKDTSNPKYDGYYETARAAIAKAEAQSE